MEIQGSGLFTGGRTVDVRLGMMEGVAKANGAACSVEDEGKLG